VPLIILRVHCAEPALTLVAEDFSRLIARLVQAGDTFTGRLCFFVRILAGRFRFHDDTRAAILLPTAFPEKISGAPILASDELFRIPRSVMTSCSRRSSSAGSDYTFGDANVRIGDVKTMLFNVL
jgi:hypothetical protein